MSAPTDRPAGPTLARRLLYAAVASTAALTLLLGGLEAALRLAGFGQSPHFFRTATLPTGDRIWRENRGFSAPYFSAALARRPQPVRLPEHKAPGTVRIFVLGSSAAMGDPEASFSFARILEKMLAAAWPERRFEIVNAAVTAINSHLVRGIAEDCAALEPDLFVVYEGHNEVIGPFGPTGVFGGFLRSEAAARAAVWLQGTRTAQLLARLGARGVPADWGGLEMFLRHEIGPDDPRLDAVRAHFRANLLAIAAVGHRAGATTLLCTAPANQRDFAPFRPGVGGAAESAYRAGRAALAAGRDAEARGLLQQALDLDPLRFRADSRLNAVIRDLGAAGAPGLAVVDVAAALAAHSPHGIPGDELFYEHVHLTFRGAYEVAAGLFPRIATDLARRGLVPAPAAVPFDVDEARIRLGYTTHEQTMIALELVNRLRRPPFAGQADGPARLAHWQRRAEAAQQLLARADATAALRELSRRALELTPDDWILARNTGSMLLTRQLPAEALPLLERAATWIDDDVDTLIALGWTQAALGRQAESEATFARARQLEPRHPGLARAPGAP